jgi:hypothetical protein
VVEGATIEITSSRMKVVSVVNSTSPLFSLGSKVIVPTEVLFFLMVKTERVVAADNALAICKFSSATNLTVLSGA